jgi:hypothetical protein
MIDATIVPVPKQRNRGDENEMVKAGETPPEWTQQPAKLRQKDRDAPWIKKHGKSFFGYKNHVNADAKHKLIRRYEVTDAAVHDGVMLDALLHHGNTSSNVFADSAYRSAANETQLEAAGFNSSPSFGMQSAVSVAQVEANRKKSTIRVRIEHVFAGQQNAPGHIRPAGTALEPQISSRNAATVCSSAAIRSNARTTKLLSSASDRRSRSIGGDMVRPCVARGFRRAGGYAVLHRRIRPLIGASCSGPQWISARVRPDEPTDLDLGHPREQVFAGAGEDRSSMWATLSRPP